MAGAEAARSSWVSASPAGDVVGLAGWDDYRARFRRYRLNWSLYENTVYDDAIFEGAAAYRQHHRLHERIRSIYNPAYRDGEFWSGALQGGGLDPAAGDGEAVQSALPILTDNNSIRKPISVLWADSEWEVEKDLYGRYGAVLGDVGLMIDDCADEEKVRIRVIHPGTLTWVRRDRPCSPVTGYVLEEMRPDPDAKVDRRGYAVGIPVPVRYREEALLDNGRVYYQTLRNGVLHPWGRDDGKGVWDVDLPFVPLVLVQHRRIGRAWGQNCFHAGLSRFREVDQLASVLGEQIRKSLKSPKAIAGAEAKDLKVPDDPDRMPYVCIPPGATVHDLMVPIDIASTCEHILAIIRDIEKMFPEIDDNDSPSGEVSGRAYRESRKKSARGVQSCRAGYDAGLVCAHKYAIAMGGARGYRGYEGFSLASLDDGSLDHRIGQRSVYDVDPADELELEGLFLDNLVKWASADLPPEFYLERNGYKPADLKKLTAAIEAATPKTPPAPKGQLTSIDVASRAADAADALKDGGA